MGPHVEPERTGGEGVARRRLGASARGTKVRTRPLAGALPGSRSGQVGVAQPPTDARTGGPGPVEPEALVVTLWFDSGEGSEPYSATVRLTGRRIGIRGTPGPQDLFTREETVDGIVPGSGPLSITTWVYGLQPGEWTVSGELIRSADHAGGQRASSRWKRASAQPLHPATWSWRRWALSTGPATPLKTRWALAAPLARIPAVIPGIWPTLSGLGVLVALTVLIAILAHEGIPVGRSLVVSLIALAAGLIGAKVWYAVLHPGPWRTWIGGWAVDGFLVVALVVTVVELLAFNLPAGLFLDASTPGLFFGVAIGRLGCFLTGCCAGRCTRSRWGVWSSDRRVGARRVPTQLLESAAGLLLGVLTALLVLGHAPTVPGLIFVAALGAYLVMRQFLLRLRAEPRRYSWRRSLMSRATP